MNYENENKIRPECNKFFLIVYNLTPGCSANAGQNLFHVQMLSNLLQFI